MAQKDVGNKIPIYKLKSTDEVMKYYDEWGNENKYNKDMVDWNYTGPKETVETFVKYEKNKDILIFDAGCGTGLVGLELKKHGFKNFYGADLSQTLLDTVPKNLYQKLQKVDLNENIECEDNGSECDNYSNRYPSTSYKVYRSWYEETDPHIIALVGTRHKKISIFPNQLNSISENSFEIIDDPSDGYIQSEYFESYIDLNSNDQYDAG